MVCTRSSFRLFLPFLALYLPHGLDETEVAVAPLDEVAALHSAAAVCHHSFTYTWVLPKSPSSSVRRE